MRELRAKAPVLHERLPLLRLVLFGSYALGRQTPASDIDLLVVYSGEQRPDAYRLVRETFDLRGLEPHIYSDSEASAMRDTVERMAEDGLEIEYGRRVKSEE
ncbi:MAG: nucleotidyltransferase domain-containing protein [Gemmatimonadota bacterium]